MNSIGRRTSPVLLPVLALLLGCAFAAPTNPALAEAPEELSRQAYDFLVQLGEIDPTDPNQGLDDLRLEVMELGPGPGVELVVTHGFFCGSGGCTTWVIHSGPRGMRLLLNTFGHLSELDSSSEEFKDLKTTVRGGATEYGTTHYVMRGGRYEEADTVSFTYAEGQYFYNSDGGGREDAFDVIYSGTMAGKYPVVMGLLFDGETVSGEYFYTKHNKPIQLSGTRRGETLSLRESVNGVFNGVFEGVMAHGTFFGAWTDASGQKTLPFKVLLH